MLQWVEAAALACLAIALAWPVPVALSRARWPERAPRAALVLWQSVGWGGGISLLTASLTVAAGNADGHWLSGVAHIVRRWPHLGTAGWVGVLLTAGLGGWLVIVAISSAARVTAARRAHRRRLDLVSDLSPIADAGEPVHVIDHPHAVAYCLPGVRPRVVMTRGVVQRLSAEELTAVLGHEQAHARGYHDLVIQPFVAWARTFPFLSPARRAVASVGLLVEMLADDAALRRASARDLAAALEQIMDGRIAETGAASVPGALDWRRQVDTRVRRLVGDTPTGLARWRVMAVYAVAVALVVVPPAALMIS